MLQKLFSTVLLPFHFSREQVWWNLIKTSCSKLKPKYCIETFGGLSRDKLWIGLLLVEVLISSVKKKRSVETLTVCGTWWSGSSLVFYCDFFETSRPEIYLDNNKFIQRKLLWCISFSDVWVLLDIQSIDKRLFSFCDPLNT